MRWGRLIWIFIYCAFNISIINYSLLSFIYLFSLIFQIQIIWYTVMTSLLNSVSQKTTFSARLVWCRRCCCISANLTSGTQQVYLHELFTNCDWIACSRFICVTNSGVANRSFVQKTSFTWRLRNKIRQIIENWMT